MCVREFIVCVTFGHGRMGNYNMLSDVHAPRETRTCAAAEKCVMCTVAASTHARTRAGSLSNIQWVGRLHTRTPTSVFPGAVF